MTEALSERLSVEDLIPVLGQQIRVNIRRGNGFPLVLCNGIGASLECSTLWWTSWIRIPR